MCQLVESVATRCNGSVDLVLDKSASEKLMEGALESRESVSHRFLGMLNAQERSPEK